MFKATLPVHGKSGLWSSGSTSRASMQHCCGPSTLSLPSGNLEPGDAQCVQVEDVLGSRRADRSHPSRAGGRGGEAGRGPEDKRRICWAGRRGSGRGTGRRGKQQSAPRVRRDLQSWTACWRIRSIVVAYLYPTSPGPWVSLTALSLQRTHFSLNMWSCHVGRCQPCELPTPLCTHTHTHPYGSQAAQALAVWTLPPLPSASHSSSLRVKRKSQTERPWEGHVPLRTHCQAGFSKGHLGGKMVWGEQRCLRPPFQSVEVLCSS